MRKLVVLLMVTVMVGLTGCNNEESELLALERNKIVRDTDGNMILLEDIDTGKITKINKEDLASFVEER